MTIEETMRQINTNRNKLAELKVRKEASEKEKANAEAELVKLGWDQKQSLEQFIEDMREKLTGLEQEISSESESISAALEVFDSV